MLNVGDRVRWRALPDQLLSVDLGTVELVSSAGYVRVAWDDGVRGTFAPVTAASRLERLEGDAALPLHDWTDSDICSRCAASWSADRDLEPCRGGGQ